MWRVKLFETRPGTETFDVSQLVSAASWTARLNGQGTASHTLKLHGSDLRGDLLREVTRGNKYTVVQLWGDTVVYAGVLGDSDWDEASSTLTLQSKELRASLAAARATFGVNQYNPSAVALTITARSHGGAVRVVGTAIQSPSSEWNLNLTLPPMDAGSFSAVFRHEEKLTFENMLAQIEADGCEITFRPYLINGVLWWQVLVAERLQLGTATDLAARAPGSIVTDLKVKTSTATLATGVLAFGKGQGQDTPYAYAPLSGSGATDQPVRDVIVTFPDIEAIPGAIAPGRPGYTAPPRLQAAANAEYARRRLPVDQWSFGLQVYALGPGLALPGSALRLWVYGSARIADGAHLKRVVALAGDLSMKVTPEVQDG